MGYTHTEFGKYLLFAYKLFALYLKFKLNWMSCSYLLNLATLIPSASFWSLRDSSAPLSPGQVLQGDCDLQDEDRMGRVQPKLWVCLTGWGPALGWS